MDVATLWRRTPTETLRALVAGTRAGSWVPWDRQVFLSGVQAELDRRRELADGFLEEPHPA